ncbi:MAG: ArnT family glycosyltransferase [Leptothrix sp. (in: b-proteobacteria)]
MAAKRILADVLRNPLQVALLIFVWLAATAGVRPLLLPDEGRYVGVAREMLRAGDWLTPTMNGLPYFHKPPLFYWLTMGSMSLFGVNEWAARAAPLLGATLGALALYLFVRRWLGQPTATVALVALLAQPLFLLGGQFANMDMLVAGCITATILALAHACLACDQDGRPQRNALLLAYAGAAAGVLAKGLIGVILPALVVSGWLIVTWRWRLLGRLLSLPGLLLFAMLAAPWFLLMERHYPGYLHYFFVVHHFQRYATAGFNNVQPFWFYPAVLLLSSLPWWPWLPRIFARPFWLDSQRGVVRRLMAGWILLVVLFFSLPISKPLGYILPAVPPLACLIGDGYLATARSRDSAQRLWWSGAATGTVLAVGFVAYLAIHPTRTTQELATRLATHRLATEPVYMLNNYYFDLPFYAALNVPVRVVDDWGSDDVARHDNWRKELAEAGRFAGPATSTAQLLDPARLARTLCDAPVSWVIGATSAAQTYPYLQQATAVLSQHSQTLWRLDRNNPDTAQALGCTGAENPI